MQPLPTLTGDIQEIEILMRLLEGQNPSEETITVARDFLQKLKGVIDTPRYRVNTFLNTLPLFLIGAVHLSLLLQGLAKMRMVNQLESEDDPFASVTTMRLLLLPVILYWNYIAIRHLSKSYQRLPTVSEYFKDRFLDFL